MKVSTGLLLFITRYLVMIKTNFNLSVWGFVEIVVLSPLNSPADEGLSNTINLLELDNNFVECRFSGLESKCSRAEPKVLRSTPAYRTVDAHC